MTYRDSVLGKNPLEFGPHARHGLPIPISRRGRKDPKRKFGHLKARDMSSTKYSQSYLTAAKMPRERRRTAAAISGIFFFQSASSEDLRH